MRTLRFTLSLMLVVPLLAVSAVAEEEEPERVPVPDPTTKWFACSGTTPEDTINYRLEDETPTWSDAEPEGSWTAGDGCGSANPSVVNGTEQRSPYDLSFAGTFEGNLDTITVRLHNAYIGRARGTGAEMPVDVRLTIDELSVFGIEERTGTDVDGLTFETITHTAPKIRRMMVTPEPSEHGLTEIYEISITGIDYLFEDDDTEHLVVLTLSTPAGAANLQNAWAWGAEETASTITFNEPVEPTFWNEAIPRDEREEHEYPE